MKYLILIFLTAAYNLAAIDIYSSYKAETQRTIVSFIDNRASGAILLSDGSLWHSAYRTLKHRADLLRVIKPDLNVFVQFRQINSEISLDLLIESPWCYQGYTVIGCLDLNNLHTFPVISDVSNCYVTLSDGSTWRETSFFYFPSHYWEAGDPVLVIPYPQFAMLINLSQTRDRYMCGRTARALLVQYQPPEPEAPLDECNLFFN